ncbi:hypothetical protein E6C27_scaffold318G001370 [Cucumis melo var. makuwa]|uniref:RNase H type-1 domain-containing protein n=1 Tax=Cucumis melo var. makuwa TaxID=1194695 RepID=A0A5A7UK30_CUCMM|nr:hypothetical protein E6C27_scaffold318G001370 [Cucumis melo var. makuwa]
MDSTKNEYVEVIRIVRIKEKKKFWTKEEVENHKVTIEETFDHDTFEEDVEAAPLSLEDEGQSTIDELKEVNLGTIEEPSPIFMSAQLSDDDENEYVNLLKEYRGVFAWSYKEMHGLDPKVVVYLLAIKPEHQPVKQVQRRFRPELISQIKEEVNKLIKAEFIREVKYPTWVANIVPVRKKNGQLRVCVDFRDLNNACPKDDFPLPIMEIMIDATARHKALSFMDGSSGYNQIRMALDEEEKISFRTPKGKVLGFIVRHRGIEVDHSKIDAIYPEDAKFEKPARVETISCLNAFDSIKKYLLNPLVLKVPATGKPLTLYITAQATSLGALLAQENDRVEKVDQSSRDALLNGLLYSNDMILYISPKKAVKGQALHGPWTMFFDGATRRSRVGVDIVFISPEKHMLPYNFTLGDLCSNNVAEYQALIIGLQMALEFGIKYIEIFGDSKLIINQLFYQYEVKHQDLKPFFIYAKRLMHRFNGIILEHIPRLENKKVDALANLATSLTVSEDVPISISLCQKWIVPSIESQYEEANVIFVYAIDEEDWRQPIIDYLVHGKLPINLRH